MTWLWPVVAVLGWALVAASPVVVVAYVLWLRRKARVRPLDVDDAPGDDGS